MLDPIKRVWIGWLILVVALVFLGVSSLTSAAMRAQLSELRSLYGERLIIVHYEKAIPIDDWRALALRLNAYAIAGVTAPVHGDTDITVRGLVGDIGRLGTRWLASGRWIDAGDARSSIAVALVAESTRRGEHHAQGDWITLDNGRFKVIGAIDQQIAGHVFGDVSESLAIIPTRFIHPNARGPVTLIVRGNIDDDAVAMRRTLESVSAQFGYRIASIWGTSELARQGMLIDKRLSQGLWIMTALTGLLAFLTLQVLIVRDINDRRGEIGLRRAMGATPLHIARMIIGEIALIVLSAVIMAIGIIILARSINPHPMMQHPIAVNEVGWSLLIVVTLTLVIGYFPAWRASRVSAMEALRS